MSVIVVYNMEITMPAPEITAKGLTVLVSDAKQAEEKLGKSMTEPWHSLYKPFPEMVICYCHLHHLVSGVGITMPH